jgi:hemerythrin-like domain-containing protein
MGVFFEEGLTMETPEKSFAEAILEDHTDILRELQNLEKAVGVESREKPAELSARLGKIQTHLTEHFRFEEDGGYMSSVLREEPRLGRVADELLAEHTQLAQSLNAIIQEVSNVGTLQDTSREKIRAWVGRVRHHEASENHLVLEAYYSSGATGD